MTTNNTVEMVSVSEDCIKLSGVVPENDPNYDGNDPLDMICWQVKSNIIDEHRVCITYRIVREATMNGEHRIELKFRFSYTGKYESHDCVVLEKDELFWKGLYSSRVACLLEAFLLDFNQGKKCTAISDPGKSLKPRKEDIERCYIPPFCEDN